VPFVSAPQCASGVCAKYLPRAEFSVEINRRVDEYFDAGNLKRRDLPRMYLKTATVLAWFGLSYAGLLLTTSPAAAVALSVSLGLAMAAIGFNIQHDGNHGGYSSRPWVNGLMARSLDLLGGSAYFWRFKHNIAHHTHTNITGQDDDFNMGVLGRLSPHDKWRPFHRFQHLYVWFLYSMLALEWQTTGELRNLVMKRKIGLTRIPFPSPREHALFWVGRLVFLGLAFGLPLAYHPLSAVLACFAIAGVTLGVTLSIVFQLAHCVEEAHFPQPDVDSHIVAREWAAHQVETTVDFAPRNRLLNWYVGGLNFQIEHHLFPRICHLHYPALSEIVRDVCRKHNVRYFVHPTMGSAFRSHWRWLRVMGREPVPSAVTTAGAAVSGAGAAVSGACATVSGACPTVSGAGAAATPAA
jgi:linoleoyl-CoA desaturase